jgi:cytochrome c553
MRFSLAIVLAATMLSSIANAAEKPARLGLCATCHGENGHATAPAIPNLAGQNLDYLRSAIRQYQTGARDVPAMRTAVGMLNAAELDRVLAWYAQEPARTSAPP